MAIGDSDAYSCMHVDNCPSAKMFKFFDHDQDSLQPARHSPAGEVRFDERGNAIYAWRDAKLQGTSTRAEQLRERALLHPGLSLVEDAPVPNQPVARNDKGSRLGYNPYESGQLTNKPKNTKRPDMRELSKWIEMKRKMKVAGPEK